MHAIWLRFITDSVNSQSWERAGHCVPEAVTLHGYWKTKKEMSEGGHQVSSDMEHPEV